MRDHCHNQREHPDRPTHMESARHRRSAHSPAPPGGTSRRQDKAPYGHSLQPAAPTPLTRPPTRNQPRVGDLPPNPKTTEDAPSRAAPSRARQPPLTCASRRADPPATQQKHALCIRRSRRPLRRLGRGPARPAGRHRLLPTGRRPRHPHGGPARGHARSSPRGTWPGRGGWVMRARPAQQARPRGAITSHTAEGGAERERPGSPSGPGRRAAARHRPARLG
jgi:hypothetical protein